MGRRLSGNGGGAPRAKTVNRSVALVSGSITTIGRFNLLAPATFAKTGGNANLTIAASTGVVSAASALAAGAMQTLNGTATGADGVIIPFVANLTGAAVVTVPALPALALTGGSTQVSIAWTDGATGGAPITAHKLYRATASGAETLVATITGGSPYVDTGLTSGTTYFYKLSAVNSAGEGALSPEQSAVASGAATVPAAPAVTLTRGNAQVTLAWTDGATGGAPITAHKLYRATASGAETLIGTIASASPYVDGSLTNGTAYFYKLSAVNSAGEGALSPEQSAIPAAVPGAPTIAITAGNAQNTVGSTDGAANGSAITARKLYRSTTSGFTPAAGNLIATNPTFPYVDSGLTNGTAYYYREIASNAVGDGAASAEQGATPVAAVGGAAGPYIVNVTAAPYAVYGARRLVSGYAGNLFTLRRASDNATQAFACAAASDLPDYAAINTWRGSSDTYVTQVFDQKGVAAPLANSVVAEQPRFETAQSSAYPALGAPFLVGAYTVGTNMNLYADGFAFDRQNISHLVIGETLGSAVSSPIIDIADSTSSAIVQAFLSSANNGRWATYEAAITYPSVNAWSPTLPSAIGFTSSTTERRFFYRDTSEAIAATTSAAAGRLRIGKNPVYSSPSWRMWGFVVYPALSTADMTSAIAGLKAIAATPAFDRRLVLAGDSISLGAQYAFYQRQAPYYFKPALTGQVEFLDRGVGGTTLADLDTNYASTTSSSNIARFYTGAYGANKCMLVIQRGINDLRSTTGTGAAAYASLTSIVSKARASGFTRIGVGTLMRDGNGGDVSSYPNLETERQDYNTRVRANTAGADFILDFANSAGLDDSSGAQSDSTKVYDGLHPTDLGYSYLGPVYAAAINAAW